jgi:hypothetical protein
MRLLAFIIGLSVSAFARSPAFADPMTFELVRGSAECSGCLLVIAKGEITGATPSRFDSFLETNQIDFGRRVTVVLSSPGGSLTGGLALGRLFRSNGLNTHIGQLVETDGLATLSSGDCASACAYAFLGGIQRSIGDRSRFGVHQVSVQSDELVSFGSAVSETQNTLAAVAEYVERMGVSRELVNVATNTPADRINWVGLSDFGTLRITNSAGLNRQRPWSLMSGQSTFSVWNNNPSGVREIMLLGCNLAPTQQLRGTLTLSITYYMGVENVRDLPRQYEMDVILKTSLEEIRIRRSSASFRSDSTSVYSIPIPYSVIRDAESRNESVNVIFDPDIALSPSVFTDHYVPLEGLEEALSRLAVSCPHLRSGDRQMLQKTRPAAN